jgi:type I restriction enzyme S subunit
MTGAAQRIAALWPTPASWEWATVGTIGSVTLGRQRSPENHVGPHMRRYVRAANITWDGWDLSDVKEMNFDAADFERFRLLPGDVLVNEGSGSAKEVGKPAIWLGQIANCCFQNTLIRVQPRACTSEFLRAYFLFSALTERFVSSTQGVNIYHIGKDGVARFPIPIPPTSEQRRIVAKVGTLSAKSKRSRDELDHIPRLVEKYKQAILAAAHTEAQRRVAQPVTLGSISTEVRNGLSKKPSDNPAGSPILRISAVRPLRVNLQDIRYYPPAEIVPTTSLLRDGDLLFTRYNGNPNLTAVCGMVRGLTRDTAYPDKLIRVRLADAADPRFVEIICASSEARDWLAPHIKTAAGQHGISGSDLKNLPLPLPSTPDQAAIVRRTETALAWIDRIAVEATSARRLIDHLDQAILAKAFQGELVPQDLSDEPASVLLERIHAEREAIHGGNGKTERAINAKRRRGRRQ